MFDIGWPELMVIAVITVLVVGPKELPRVLRSFTMLIRRLREIASEFQSGLDDLAREAELEEIQKELADSTPGHLVEDFEQSIASDMGMNEEFEEIKDVLELESEPDKAEAKKEKTAQKADT